MIRVLESAGAVLRLLEGHVGTATCPAPSVAQESDDGLTLRDASVSVRDIEEIQHALRHLAEQVHGDLRAMDRLLAGRAACACCQHLRSNAAAAARDLTAALDDAQ